MTALSHDEMDLHYRWRDEKWEARWAAYVKLSDERAARFDAIMDERFARLDVIVDHIKADNLAMRADIAEIRIETKRECQKTKVAVVTTAIASVIAIAAFNATVLSNMVASYESGKSTAAAIATATERLNQLQEKTDRTSERLETLLARYPEQDAAARKSSRR